MKKRTVIIIVIFVVIIILAVSAWIIYKKFFKKEADKDGVGAGGDYIPPVYSGGGGGYSSSTFPIKKGMSGQAVIVVQDSINKKCNANLTKDGKFGPKTEAALKSCYNTTVVTEALFNQMNPPTGNVTAPIPPNQKVFLKGSAANIYSYPEFANNYIVGTVEKSFFLDRPIGLYVSPAVNGLSKIKVFGYKPYGSATYKVEAAREVFISTSAISKTPY